MRAGRSRSRVALAGLVALVLVAAGAVAWFQPQKLFIDGTRLDRYRSVVIWCRRFTYAFGAARLAPAR